MLIHSGDFSDNRDLTTLTVIDPLLVSKEILASTVNARTRAYEVLRSAHYLGNVVTLIARDLEVQMDHRGRFDDWKLTATPDTKYLTHSPPAIEESNESQTKYGIGIKIRMTDGMASLFSQTDEIIPNENHVTQLEYLHLPTLGQLKLLEEDRNDEDVFAEIHHSLTTHDRREGRITSARIPLILPDGRRVIDDLEPAPFAYFAYFKQATTLIDRTYKSMIRKSSKP